MPVDDNTLFHYLASDAHDIIIIVIMTTAVAASLACSQRFISTGFPRSNCMATE